MVLFFAAVGAWLIGWGILLATLLLRAALLPSDPIDPSLPHRRGHALTLLDTTEIAL